MLVMSLLVIAKLFWHILSENVKNRWNWASNKKMTSCELIKCQVILINSKKNLFFFIHISEAKTEWTLFLHRIPSWLLRPSGQLRFLPSRTPFLTSSVSSRVPLPPRLGFRTPWGRPGLCAPPRRRPKVHGHDLSRRHPQSRARHDRTSSSQSTGGGWLCRESTLPPGQQHQLQWPHVPSWSRDGGEHCLVEQRGGLRWDSELWTQSGFHSNRSTQNDHLSAIGSWGRAYWLVIDQSKPIFGP